MTKQKEIFLTPKTVIDISWGGIPDAILSFPMSVGLSGAMIVDREAMIALPPEEKAAKLFEFRLKLLADVLYARPYMVDFKELNNGLQKKIDAEVFKIENRPDLDADPKATGEQLEKIKAETGLTEEEVDRIKRPFPGWPEEGDLAAQAMEYFGQEDERGRKIFHTLLEDLAAQYFLWATPRPTISVSVFMQGKRGTFTAS